ncbi:unnamed protein product [Pseudo-nitzschia multistriata]|uniref:Uncharacterized protein n=1 Tax=Pseudo-nitzschia multistriata TaxID=183589 RepID=A0A448Z1Z3_9STRA|nr:unnamed protein product [Pseudo-nitzschia multistriata]
MSDNHHTGSLLWTLVNLIVVFLSVILATDIVFAVDDRQERPGAIAEHLVYNVGTSVLWVAEVAWNTYDMVTLEQRPPHWKLSLAVEWAISIYFVVDSINLMLQWRGVVNGNGDEELGSGLFDAVQGIVTYSYLAASSFLAYETSMPYQPIQDVTPSLYPWPMNSVQPDPITRNTGV